MEGIYRIPGNRAEGDLLFSKILEGDGCFPLHQVMFYILLCFLSLPLLSPSLFSPYSFVSLCFLFPWSICIHVE